MKKGQISTEVMYSIGVMVIIFLILSGITFNRRLDLQKTSDFLKKKNECLKIADTLSSMWLAGSDLKINMTFKYPTSIFSASRIIIVGEQQETAKSIEATCDYTANSTNYQGLLGKYTIKNEGDVITITQ